MREIEKYKDSLTLGNKLRRLFWNTCRLFLFRPFAGPLFWKWRNLVLKCFGARIGEGSKISNSAKIWAPWNLRVGKVTSIGPGAIIYSADQIILGDKVTVSQGAFLCTASHEINKINKPLITKPIIVGNFSWICADAFVSMGVTIGEGSVVGARAAIFKDVEPWTVVGGNPAKFIKKRVIEDD